MYPFPPLKPSLHAVHAVITRPGPEFLTIEPEDDSRKTPDRCQTHIGHDWWHVTSFDHPRRNELRETIAPQIFVDCDAHKDGARYRLV